MILTVTSSVDLWCHHCYLQPEADQSHDNLSTDLKPVVCLHQSLKLFGQGHLLKKEDIIMLTVNLPGDTVHMLMNEHQTQH